MRRAFIYATRSMASQTLAVFSCTALPPARTTPTERPVSLRYGPKRLGLLTGVIVLEKETARMP